MSLIGIDVGTSAVKATAFQEDGTVIRVVSAPVKESCPEPGLSEVDPNDVWKAVCRALKKLSNIKELKRDPPKALAVSASGDDTATGLIFYG